MKIYREIPLTEFEFWCGGKDTVEELTEEELNQIEEILEEIYPEGMDETEVNDFFWFERELIAEWLGYKNFDEIMEREE
jgi:iron-sulfur cluster repair protein YtfE (RIC family)